MIHTRAVWIGKHEVVEVRFHPKVTSNADLLTAALDKGYAKRVWSTSDAQHAVATKRVGDLGEKHDGDVRVAQKSDQLYYLEHSPFRLLPLKSLDVIRKMGYGYGDIARVLSELGRVTGKGRAKSVDDPGVLTLHGAARYTATSDTTIT